MLRRSAFAENSGTVQNRFATLNGCRSLAPILLVIAVAVVINAAGAAGDAVPQKPAAEIDLKTVGFSGLSTGARQSGASNLSVDFLDSRHVLLTFNPKRLFKRHPECPPSHADRLVHAIVMEVPSGKVAQETDWYLHDSRRYVWALGEGRVLLRRLNRLYEVNSKLEEKLLYDSPKDLLWVSVTSDRKQIIVEVGDGEAFDESSQGVASDSTPRRHVRISFLDATTPAVRRTIETGKAIRLEATGSGVANVRKVGSNWLVEFGNSYIARVRAERALSLLYTSGNTLLLGRCSAKRVGYSVSAFTVTGTPLWRQHWDECRYSPIVRSTDDGGRFGISSLTLRPRPGNITERDPGTSEEALVQHLQVLDTATGQATLSVTTAPAVPDGQNFALSPDGRLAVVISGTALELYELAEMSADDRTRYLAAKTDLPNLNVPAPQTDAPGTAEAASTPSAIAGPSDGEFGKDLAAASPSQPSASTSPAENKEPVPTLTIRTGTQVVALDVVVTDSAGRLVRGLQQSDFTVAEDGKPQALRYFKEFADVQPAPAPPVPLPKKLPPNIFTNYTLPAEEGAVTVVLLDLLNTPISDQAYAQEQLIKFLKNKPRLARFALCILGDRLQMVQGFSEDKATLLAAAKGKPASDRLRPLHQSDPIPPITIAGNRAITRFEPGLDSFANMMSLQQSEARLLDADHRMIVTVDAFAHLARYLSGVPGRKNLVWLSGSFLLGIYPDSNGQNPFLGTRHYGDNLKKVANLLGEAHVAVYPVGVKGLEANPFFSAASDNALAPLSTQGAFPSRPGPAGSGGANSVASLRSPNPNLAIPVDVMRDQLEQFELAQSDEHATMTELAAHTGGQAFFNNNGIAEAIRTATEQGSNYYALSYTPSNKKYDGSFRKVNVTLAGKKYHLAHRSGYYAMDPFAPVKPPNDLSSALARAAMQAGSPQSRQIVFGSRVVPVGKPHLVQDSAANSKASKKHAETQAPLPIQRYALDHEVRFADLRFTPSPDGVYHDMLNFMVTAFDQDGKLMASQLAQTAANFNADALKDAMLGGVRMHQEIDVPVNSIMLRLGVEEVSNGHIGTLEIPLPVPAPPETQEGMRRKLPAVEPD